MGEFIVADEGGPGLKVFRNTALVATAVAVKASAGRNYGWYVYNPNSADAWLQVYDVAQAGVTVGTTTPNVSYWIPGLGGVDLMKTPPVEYDTAITCAATTTFGGSTAPATGLVVMGFYR